MKFITFSRQLGSGGAEIAGQVAEKLGYRLHDTRSIDASAQELGFLESVERINEKTPSLFRRIFSQTPGINLDRLNSVIYQLANRGNSVFIGRGGQLLLRSFSCALHVRIIASRETRIRNLLQRGYTEETASKAIEDSDRERANFIKFAFGKDWDEPNLYDFVLNVDKINSKIAVETIVSLARSEEIQTCSLHSIETLAKLALSSRTEAALTESGLSYGPSIAVTSSVEQPGIVTLIGLVGDDESKARAEEVVKSVKGVEAIDNRIRVRPADRHA
jgi:cytidylate kinase